QIVWIEARRSFQVLFAHQQNPDRSRFLLAASSTPSDQLSACRPRGRLLLRATLPRRLVHLFAPEVPARLRPVPVRLPQLLLVQQQNSGQLKSWQESDPT